MARALNFKKQHKLILGECIEKLASIPDGSIDLVLADPPFGTTACKWDVIIPLKDMWRELLRVAKPNAAILLHAAQPFTSVLINSNLSMYKYSWVWHKTMATGHLFAKKQPLRAHEDICVFYNSQPTYNPQKTTGHARKVSSAHHKRNVRKADVYGEYGETSYDSTERYPRSVLTFAHDTKKSALTPTQKPLALEEYFVRTYTDEGDVVLDFCMGSGTSIVAAAKLGRGYVGIEQDPKTFDKAFNRMLEET